MKYSIFLFLFCIALFSCKSKEKAAPVAETPAAAPMVDPNLPVLTDEEKANGWKLLFDGTSTAGWHRYGGAPIGPAWKASDGSLMLDASNKEGWQSNGGGDIVTNEEYENYHLKIEWKIDTCGNSGIIFGVHEDTVKYDYVWHTGPEMQVLDNACHPDAKIIKHRAGDLYDLISSSVETVRPALEWNQAEIVSNAGALDLYLNGQKVVSTHTNDAAWKKLIAGSKFKSMKDFGSFAKGGISLQDHGHTVWFRNIKIKSL
ncbi:MAG: DUF1080 domain-containing protein [Saprospiraceae bacterium]|nr:DUF1080 domain-containing protein [Saprospiraceae bacterium]MBK7373940.1 DUF1080 domain-containing protein [Saprospiraceae bacterium]